MEADGLGWHYVLHSTEQNVSPSVSGKANAHVLVAV